MTFSLYAMGQPAFDRVEVERKRRGMSRVEVADYFGVTKQAYTNWDRRGIPRERFGKVADFLDCTVDDLVGRGRLKKAPLHVAETTMLYGYGVTQEGAQMAAEWQKLDPDERAAIRVLIESFVASARRRERIAKAKPPANRTSGSPPN